MEMALLFQAMGPLGHRCGSVCVCVCVHASLRMCALVCMFACVEVIMCVCWGKCERLKYKTVPMG
jgi:hypothetical protein